MKWKRGKRTGGRRYRGTDRGGVGREEGRGGNEGGGEREGRRKNRIKRGGACREGYTAPRPAEWSGLAG